MTLEKSTIIDKIEIVGPYRHIQIRTATVIMENDVELSRSYHRRVITPGDDLSGETSEVVNISSAVHTKDVKEAYKLEEEKKKKGI